MRDKIKVGKFVRLLGEHERAMECGTIEEINGNTATFKFHSDGVLTVQPLKNFSADTLVYWGL